MAFVLSDRIKETTTTTSTGTYTLGGAVSGFETFTANLSNGDTTYYCCTDGTDFEVGLGTFASSGTTLARTTIISSSNSNNAVNWSSGSRDIFCTLPGSKAIAKNGDGDITLADSEEIQLGNSGDLRIFHNGSHSIIKDGGTGDLELDGSIVKIRNAGRTEDMIVATQNGSVELYHNNVKKLETTSSGATVTGTLSGNVTGDLTGDVTGNVSGTAATVTGAAQTNITSVGTLTGLTTSGTINLSQTSGAAIKTTGNLSASDLTVLRASGSTDGTFGFDIKYMGSRSSNNNSYSLFMHNQTGTDVEAMTVLQDGKVGINNTSPSDTLDVAGDTTITGDLTILSTDAGSGDDPNLVLYRNSSSPADDDNIGSIQFKGRNDNSQDVIYGEIQSIIQDASDGTEDSSLSLQVRRGGTATTYINLSGESGRVNIQRDLFITTGFDITFEGDTSDAFETVLKVADPTADRVVTLPDATGTVTLLNATQTLTNKTLTSPKINEDVAVTATATEINKLDGVTATTTELNYVDVSTAGTVEASKAVVVDSNKDASGFRNLGATGTLTLTGGDSGDVLLVFNTDRTWQFQQLGDDATTRLQLKANAASKSFDIVDSDGDTNFTFATSASAPVFLLAQNATLQFEGATSDGAQTTLTVVDPTADRTVTLPDATGTVLTTGNSDTPSTTTSSSDADFVLVDDGGTMKKITPSNLGITSGGASKGFAVAMAIAL